MKAWRDLTKLPRELWILCFATLVNRMGTMALPFLVIYLTRSLGFSAAKAGMDLGLYGVVAFLVGPIAGKLSDRFGPLRMMEAMLISSGIVLVLFPLAHSGLAIAMMTALFAATNEAFRPANLALVGELGPPGQRKPAFALSRFAVNLGMSVGPAIGGILAQFSFPLLFIVDGLTAFVAASILLFSPFHQVVKKREQEMRKPDDAAPQLVRGKRTHPLSALFADASLRVFLLGILPVALVFFQHQSSLPLFLIRNMHFSEATYGILFTINTLLIIVLEIPLNAATSNWSYRRTLGLGSLLFGVGFGSLALVHTYWEVVITVVIWTFGEMILFPGMSAYVSEISPRGRHGEYMGLYMMAFSLAFMAGPLLGMLTFEHYGATSLWIATFVTALVSVGMLSRTKGNVQ